MCGRREEGTGTASDFPTDRMKGRCPDLVGNPGASPFHSVWGKAMPRLPPNDHPVGNLDSPSTIGKHTAEWDAQSCRFIAQSAIGAEFEPRPGSERGQLQTRKRRTRYGQRGTTQRSQG